MLPISDGGRRDPLEIKYMKNAESVFIRQLLERSLEFHDRDAFGNYDGIFTTDCDIVSAKRIHRQEKFTRRLLAKSFHFVFARLSAMQRLVDVGNFSLFNRKALSAMLSFHEKLRYLPGLRSLIGFNHEYVEYSRQDRPTGRSRITVRMLFRLAFDAFFPFPADCCQ